MKTTFYFNGKRITKKAATELLGKDKLNSFIEEAKETFFEDPYIENEWLISGGRFGIEFS